MAIGTVQTTETATSLELALGELDKAAPGAPLLALGQTVLWDEPMKGGAALMLRKMGSQRKFIAGVHDTDYFAKLPSGERKPGKFVAVPHNDTTTRNLWSAAGEFSALFGSETVVTRQDFLKTGLRMAAVLRKRKNAIDAATEAWRWKGIVSLDEDPPLACEVPLHQLFDVLQSTLDWALEETMSSLTESEHHKARQQVDRLHELVCDQVDDGKTLTSFYRDLIPSIYAFAAGEEVPLEATTTSDLLRFTPETAGLPRFELVDLFLNPKTRISTKEAYDEAIRGSEIYELNRFGTGAIPFDLVIPGKGRGTIRIGTKGAVISTREPQFLSFKKPIGSVHDLAKAIVDKFGRNCVLIGKAVTLIGMLSREFVFVFHEGASSYVKHSRRFHDLLSDQGFEEPFNPILRIKYSPWDALNSCCSWIRMPEPLRGAFGTEELCGPSLAGRWKEVAKEQKALLAKLAELRRPLDLIRFLEEEVGGSWKSLAAEYQDLHGKLEGLAESVRELKNERKACYETLHEHKQQRVRAEVAKGEHWRARFFENSPSDSDQERRKVLTAEVDHAIRAIEEAKQAIAELMRLQTARVSDATVQSWHERRRAIELEAELKRMRLIRQAVVASRGLEKAGLRPSAWWFPVVCPGGNWFKETVATAEAYLEPLTSKPA